MYVVAINSEEKEKKQDNYVSFHIICLTEKKNGVLLLNAFYFEIFIIKVCKRWFTLLSREDIS